MIKIVFWVLRATFAIATLVWVPAALADSVEITSDPAALALTPGQHADVNLVLSSDVELRGAQLKIIYDPHVVLIDSVTEGTYFRQWADSHGATAAMVFPFTPNNETGQTLVGGIALFGGLPRVGASGSAPLITAHLTGVATTQATASLRYEAVVLADNESQRVPQIKVTGVEVTVGPAAANPPALPTPSIVTQPANRLSRAPVSPLDAIYGWLMQHLEPIRTVGVGLIVAGFAYVLIVRLASPGARVTRADPPPNVTHGHEG